MILLFWASLIFFHYAGGSKDFDAGQVRRAMATTFICFYFALLPISPYMKIESNSLATRLFDHFDIIILTIMGFYFGSRVVEKAVDSWERTKKTNLIYRV